MPRAWCRWRVGLRRQGTVRRRECTPIVPPCACALLTQIKQTRGRRLPRAGVAGQAARRGYSVKTLPGFMMFKGSSARLMPRIICTAAAPASSAR